MNQWLELTLDDLQGFAYSVLCVITRKGLRKHWVMQGYYSLTCILGGHGSD